MLKKVILFITILSFVFPGLTHVIAQEDVEGSEDHPMITRYADSHITDYQQFAYDQQELVTGMEEDEFERAFFEGKVTRIRYEAPEGRSEFEVHRNYQSALQDAGFELVYECIDNDAECREIGHDTPLNYQNSFSRGSHRHYTLARLTNSEGDIHVAVYTARRHGDNRTLLVVVEELPMESGKVQVDRDAEVVTEDMVEEENDIPEDVEDSADHTMITRYEGSYITDYQQFAYDRQELVTGMEEDEFERAFFEGKVTRIRYEAPEGRSEFEVHRNYQSALQDAGFELVYECIDNDIQCREIGRDTPLGYPNSFQRGSHRHYSLARLTNPAGDIHVAVYTARRHGDNRTLLIVVEEQPMEAGMVDVSVDAATMASDLDDAGRVMIYGIHFDTGQADIKPESEPTLAEIAELLNNNPDLNLGVVGHTDAVGGLEDNMDLSERRAEAVVDYLVSEHEISDERLSPHGVAFLAPEATNETEEARALNRRVELVNLPD